MHIKAVVFYLEGTLIEAYRHDDIMEKSPTSLSDAEAVLGRAWEAVSRSQSGQRGGQLVFNFLSDRARRKNESTGPAHRYDPARLVSWALDRTPLVVLRHDYWGGHDATVWMGAG